MSKGYADPLGMRDVLRELGILRVRHKAVDFTAVNDAILALSVYVEEARPHAALAKHLLSLGQEFARGHGGERDESGQARLGDMAAEMAEELLAYERQTREGL